MSEAAAVDSATERPRARLGTFAGVFTPTLLTILGAGGPYAIIGRSLGLEGRPTVR